jgi:Arc/MetJ family transcription regulator
MKVDVAYLSGGRVVRKTLDMSKGSAEVASAGKVWLDPDVRWMAQIEDQQSWTAAELGALYRVFNAAGKTMVLRKAGERKHFAFLARIAKSERNPEVVAAAMGQMEASQTADLLALSKHADPWVRANAARMLGNGPKTDAVVARLRAMWRQPGQTELKAAAAEALLKHTGDRAFAERLLGMPSFNERLRQLAVDWLAGVDRSAAFAKYVEFASGGYAEPLRLHALGRLAGYKNLDTDRRAYRLLLQNAQGPVFRSKMEAIRGLAEYGDRSAAEVLRPLTEHGLHFVRNAAREALQQLDG